MDVISQARQNKKSDKEKNKSYFQILVIKINRTFGYIITDTLLQVGACCVEKKPYTFSAEHTRYVSFYAVIKCLKGLLQAGVDIQKL